MDMGEIDKQKKRDNVEKDNTALPVFHIRNVCKISATRRPVDQNHAIKQIKERSSTFLTILTRGVADPAAKVWWIRVFLRSGWAPSVKV